jgi:hypothetical protein
LVLVSSVGFWLILFDFCGFWQVLVDSCGFWRVPKDSRRGLMGMTEFGEADASLWWSILVDSGWF